MSGNFDNEDDVDQLRQQLSQAQELITGLQTQVVERTQERNALAAQVCMMREALEWYGYKMVPECMNSGRLEITTALGKCARNALCTPTTVWEARVRGLVEALRYPWSRRSIQSGCGARRLGGEIMTHMNWEQKLAALQAIADTSLRMRKPGNWYVDAVGRSIAGDGLLRGSYGQGKTPSEAVEDDWRQIVDHLPSGRYIVVERAGKRREVKWSGFMWEDYVK